MTYTRKDKRLQSRFNTQAKIKSHSWQKGVDQGLVNISKSGCKIITNIIYHIGDIILITIANKYIVGKIVRCNHCGYGIKFIKETIRIKL